VDLLNKTHNCGEAIYDNILDTIHLVLNKRDDCVIDIAMVSAVKVKMKFGLEYEDFFKDDTKTTFA